MRLLITHPYCWPYVRRGSERFLAELSSFIASRGHEVTVLSTSPKGDEEQHEGGVRIVRKRQIPLNHFAGAFIYPESTFSQVCEEFLGRYSFDVIHCLYHSDVLGARRGAPKTPCIFHITGVPFGGLLRRYPMETWLVRQAIRHAARVLVVSDYAARRYHAEFSSFGKPPDVLPVPSVLNNFAVHTANRDLSRPIILFMGALDEDRKGALPLARAFNFVKEKIPTARLQYCGRDSAAIRSHILAVVGPRHRTDVQFLGTGQLEEIPSIYASAAVTVLPAVDEAFGMIVVESLAAGTPVVSSSESGASEVVMPTHGRVFAATRRRKSITNIQGLADAIEQVIGLHNEADLRSRCRAAVRRFDWNWAGQDYEHLYHECIASSTMNG